MSLYEARLQADRDAIDRRLKTLAESVREALGRAVKAMVAGDLDACYLVALDDKPINRESRAIDALCHEFVARHFPAAGHLRFISSALRLNVEIERLGDYAVNLGLSSVRLSAPPSGELASKLGDLAEQALEMLSDAISAWATRDAEFAQATRSARDRIEAGKGRLEEWLGEGTSGLSARDTMILGDLIHNLERVSGQARNICEETLFTVSGVSKPATVYRVLFVDERNDRLSQLAEAFARKAFPQSGNYASAGWAPADELDREMRALARAAGLDLGGALPRDLEAERAQLHRYQVVVALGAGARQQLGRLPYKTIALEWRLDEAELPDQFKQLAANVQELMVTLRGEGAT